ncbi:MAG: glycogen synthase [Deltaproteobacteria bacterium]|nr:glycogen synthase [Deltaproteobacteria bacterium]
MRVLFVSPECAPFAKAGGLGDVVGALPKALRALGVDARVVIPRYGFLSNVEARLLNLELSVPIGSGDARCNVYETTIPSSNVPVYLLRHDPLYDAGKIYEGYGNNLHELARVGVLSRGALVLCRQLGWVPDIVHIHDWPSSITPVLLNTVEAGDSFFRRTASVLSIHNIVYQPKFPAEGIELLHVGRGVFRPDGLEDHGEINLLKGGMYHSTMLVAVSPRYAAEITMPNGGGGLEHVARYRAADLVGIINGIDDEVWDPAKDPYLPTHYSAQAMAGKAANKSALQAELGFEIDPRLPLFGVVSRLTHQKGIDLVLDAMDRILALDAQVVFLGSGDPELEARMKALSHPRVRAHVGYSEKLAHLIEAGADFFLMPSRYEPCGLNQLYSQRYGTIPIVRATGGLDDTVDQIDERLGTGTGFKIKDLSAEELAKTAARAVKLWRDHREVFDAVRVRAMSRDFGWKTSAKRYIDVYGWALERVIGKNAANDVLHRRD